MTAIDERDPTSVAEDAADARTRAFGFPVFLDVRDRVVLVAGGGHEPASKAATLAALGAHVRVWANEHRETAPLAAEPGVALLGGPFAPELLDDVFLAIVGTGDPALDRRIATAARSRGVLVNTVDDVP
jgi:uroporphyrin-III C-methyltransferase/precorrin-2 dehydrogenase/sirohydrochlorin ferrochelatase